VTVKELIAQLERLDENSEVYFAHPSHDYWKTELASEVNEVTEAPLKHSGYHDQMATVDEEDREDGEKLYVVLR
jgi:hypothetical protein